jgi:MarR-like DNA-binding transcriptional regulator SgrR of sgrS sRNA
MALVNERSRVLVWLQWQPEAGHNVESGMEFLFDLEANRHSKGGQAARTLQLHDGVQLATDQQSSPDPGEYYRALEGSDHGQRIVERRHFGVYVVNSASATRLLKQLGDIKL